MLPDLGDELAGLFDAIRILGSRPVGEAGIRIVYRAYKGVILDLNPVCMGRWQKSAIRSGHCLELV